ncbi:D-TA family PLP-dependent enzyme [Spongiimicrobium sp. 2-473A-2-J]|uniref:D-TA family PLP-dependent enzyme n=1 Tax=Eudoraea algarum TaxID=3417568 RepID=UPI003D36CD7A
MEQKNWYALDKPEEVISPSLLVYPERIEKNIQRMIGISGGVQFLRPHVKTHKMAEIIKMQLKHGIYKFKCATIAEAELLAQSGATDILLAVQPTGANIPRLFALMETYRQAKFSAIVDSGQIIDQIATMAKLKEQVVSLWLDINNGMNRTGIVPGDKAFELYRALVDSPQLVAAGLHVYDGHIRDPDFSLRKEKCDTAFQEVIQLKERLQKAGMPVEHMVAGGSPSFEIHAARKNVETSPGTTLLWDRGYGGLFPEMQFLPAAVLMTRVISKPRADYLCFDLGHKSVASEMPLPRVEFLNAGQYTQMGQSEEHLVVESPEADTYAPGDIAYVVPKHICPTVAKYDSVLTVKEGKVTGRWKVAARDHKMLT